MMQNPYSSENAVHPNDAFYENIYQNNPSSAEPLPFLYSAAKPLHQNPTDNLESLRWHEQIEIKLFLRGKAEIICGPQVFIAEEGDIVVINSGVLHAIRQYGNTEPVYHLLMISVDQLVSEKGYKELIPLLEGRISIQKLIRKDTALQDVLINLFQELESKKEDWFLASMGYLTVLMALLLRHQETSSLKITPENRQYIDKIQPAIVYIQKNYREAVRIETLAKTCSLSPYHFSRLFKKTTGYTPVEFLNHFRIQKAATMLKIADLSISDIAYSVGFNDEAYFSRCFKTYMHDSPKKYREEYQIIKNEQNPTTRRQDPACTMDV